MMHDSNLGPSAAATSTRQRAYGYTPDHTPGPGQVVWHELRSSDTVQARDFYSRLFGWAVRPAWAHPADRAVLHLEGMGVATMVPLDRADGDDSHWLTIVATPDVDECCSQAPELRGSVYPSLGERRGMAVLEDPQGAVWAIAEPGVASGARPVWHRPPSHQQTTYRPAGYRPPGYRPAGRPAAVHEPGSAPAGSWSWADAPGRAASPAPSPVPPGTIGKTLLLTPDPLDALEFYGSLLDWRFRESRPAPIDGGLLGAAWVARTSVGEQAAVVGSTPAFRARLPRPTWLPCISVGSLDESLEAAWTLGATVIVGDAPVPALGRLAVIQDPTGAVLALLEPIGPSHRQGERSGWLPSG